MAKKGFFRTAKAFSLALALFGAVFSSCENLNDVSSRIVLIPEAQGHSNGGQGAGGQGGSSDAAGASSIENCLTASVSLPGLPSLAGIAPLPKNVARYAAQSGAVNPAAQSGADNAAYSADQDSALDGVQKSAFPNIADAADPSYSFSATLTQSGGATYSADGTYNSVAGTCSFAFAGAQSASEASYTLTVSLYHTDGTPAVKSLVASGSQSVTVGADAPSFSASVSLLPNLASGAPNGSLLLPIKFSDTSVTSVQLTLLDSGNHDVTASYLDCGTSLTLTGGSGTIESVAGGLPPGTYTLLMSFLKGTVQVGARTESLNVYPAMETSLWWTKDGIGAAATALSVTQFNQKEFYVRGTGGVFYTTVFPTAAEAQDTNNGSFAFPLKTIQEAVNRIKASGDTTSQYTVYIDGKVTVPADADYSTISDDYKKSLAYIDSAQKIAITGWTGSGFDIIDCGKKCRAITAASGAEVAITKLAIKNGDGVNYGGALYVGGGDSTVVLDDGVLVNGNHCETNGGAIYCNGNLYICGSAVVGDYSPSMTAALEDDCGNLCDGSGGGVSCSGNLYLGYSGKNSSGGLIEKALSGGIYRNYSKTYGGGIYSTGTVTMASGSVDFNAATSGGGVYVSGSSTSSGKFYMGGTSRISGNNAINGGGVYINSNGKCFISGAATIGQSLASTSICATSSDGSHSNKATQGGGIYNAGELYLGYTDDSTPAAWTGSVCYNYASSDGGGILSSGSSSLVKMNAGSVAYNLCSDGSGTTGGGGGVAVQNSSAFTMSGGTVSYNQTNNKVGGGIYVDSGATLTLNGTAEVSSNKTSPDGTGSMGGAGLFAYRASIMMEGNAVVKDNLCKACGGGVYLFESESASSYASLAMSGNAKIFENTSSDGLGGAVYVTQRCSFSMQGAATIPAGVAGTTGAGKNDVYLDENTSVAVPAAITSTATPVATITPKSPYAVNTTVLTGAALSDAQCAKFALTQPAGVEFPWTIEYDSTNGGVLKHDRNVFYVADYGDNTSGDGTKDNPYETIKFALTKFTDNMPASVDFKNKIYVLTNMTYDAGLGSDVPCYYEIVGCMGGTVGSNVTFTFNTPDDSGLYVAYGQKIKLTHIDITQSSATANNYAAILVENSSTNGVGELWMEDSSIKNMYAKSCSAIAAKGDVHLKNVEISGNKTVANTSGATPFGPAINSTTGTVSALGKLVIKDNKMQINTAAAGDPPSYVYKDQNLWIGENTGTAVFHPIRIAGVLDGESDIGVTLFDYGTLYTTFTSGFASAGISAPSDVFASDDGMSVIKNISGEAIMTAPVSLYVSQTGNDLIGNGSRMAPFATINKAISTINAFDTSGISYTIYVGGTVKGYAEIPDGVKAAKITLDKDPLSLVTNTLDGVGKASPVLTINAAIPVDISNLTITRGSRGVDIEKSATVKITDCVVTGNDATGKTNIAGAGIYVPEASAITPSLTITGGEVSDNTATGLGGGIHFGAGTLTIENVEISGNEATGTNKNGGGLYVGGTGGYVSGFTMTGGSIDGNTSSKDGGGATINCKQSANALLDGVTISGNTASAGNGGGIAITSGKYLSVKDCIVINNTATGGNGGGIYNAGTCYIYGSTAIGEEGAISAAHAGAGEHSNIATVTTGASPTGGQGGGIYNASTLHFGYYNDKSVTPAQVKPDTGFSGGVWYNYAADMGGGVFNAGTMMMSKGQIVRNGSKYGAGVANVDATATFASGSLTYNSASTGGGGIFNKKSDPADTTTSSVVNLNGIHVVGNTVSPTGGGGGVMNQYGTLNFTSGQINFNSGGQYGGAILTLGPVSITGGSIQNNSAILGGGIYVYQDTVEMSGGTISANTSNVDASAAHPEQTGHGGGVFIYNGTLKMSSGTISGNTAKSGKGGAVYVANDASTYTGNFVISGDASIPLGTTNNDVFLCNAITIDGNLTATAPVATITPSIYDASAQVLIDGSGTVAGNYDKFAVTPDGSDAWSIDQYGYLSQSASSGGSVTIYTPDGQLGLSVNTTEVTTSASATSIIVSAKNASGVDISTSADISGWTLDWYYGSSSDPIVSSSGRTFSFPKTYPKGTYRLTVSVVYKGTTYSDTFTIKKTVD